MNGPWPGFVAVTGAALALYASTLCPDLYWFDSAELVNDAVLLDIPHPPGYPLFNLLAALFVRVPHGTLAARVNFLSACAASLGVGFLYLSLRTMGVRAFLAAAGAMLLAVSHEYWELAVVAEVYSVEAALVTYNLWRIARLESAAAGAGGAGGAAGESEVVKPVHDGLLALGLGLMLFHRPTVLFFLVPWLVLLARRIARPGRFLALMGAGALPYLHTAWVFFVREVPAGQRWSINYFDFPRTPETFFKICTGTLYAGNVDRLSAAELAAEVIAYGGLFVEQFGAVVAAIAVYGAGLVLTGRLTGAARYLVATAAGNVVFFLFYNALEKDTMYVPSFIALLALAVLVADHPRMPARLRVPIAIAMALCTAWIAARNLPAVDRSRYHEVRRCVDSTARLLPPRSWLYLTDDLIIHPFQFVMLVEGLRGDVSLRIVDGFGPEVERGLTGEIARQRRVFSPLFYPEETFRSVQSKFRLVPRGFLYEIHGRLDGIPRLPPLSGAEWVALNASEASAHPARTAGPASPGLALGAWSVGPGRLEALGWGVFPRDRTARRSDLVQVVVTWRWTGGGDPAAVLSLTVPGAEPLRWAYRIGYQGRPWESGRGTEEYFLKIPWWLARAAGGPGRLELAVIPSISAAAARGEIAVRNTRDWEERPFFKGRTLGFIRCMERGRPAFSEWLDLRPSHATGLARPVLDVGPLALVEERRR
jgi:hypothetical protein